jgi:hypothetical protein
MKQKEVNAKKWFISCLVILIAAILGVFLLVWVFDPYFHFHKPFSFVSYRLYDERYANDGISRHFDYDTIITGTSMSQNFKTSEADKLFGVKSVKESFSGAGYKELSENLDRALSRHDVENVIWTMDFNSLIRYSDYDQYSDYPTYLYDDNPWNDVSYVFNKSILYHGVLTDIIMTLTGQESTTFDEYSSWDKPTGYEHIMDSYDRLEEKLYMEPGLTDEEKEMVYENVYQNFVELVNKYPNVTFYIFYTPYSICWWDYYDREGRMNMQFDAELISTQLLLQCQNVRLYNFNDKYDIIENLDNYRDKEHYSAEINSMILEWISEDEGLVTKGNYIERLEKEKEYYLNYDYESIFTQDLSEE